MFTGIVEETGTVKNISVNSVSGKILIAAKTVIEGTKTGDSIAVNGVCLTVTALFSEAFTADVMAETLRCTALNNLSTGSRVNLERAMPANGRFGGHIVSGHVDGTGVIAEKITEGNAVRISIFTTYDVLSLIVKKGSVAIDGISLTVADVFEKGFCVSIIPHTAKNTSLLHKKTGDHINIETDIIGKYVRQLLFKNSNGKKEYDAHQPCCYEKKEITEAFLLEHGF